MMSQAVERIYERLLIVRCQTGDAGAVAELIRRYSPRLRFYLRKMAGDATADDLLQDVWIDILARLGRLHDPGAFCGWAYKIARMKAYGHLRRRRGPPTTIDEEMVEPAQEEPDEQWTSEDVQRVRAALTELEPEHREVLLLRFVEDMSYDQIAAVVACPVGTIRSRLYYAKRSLRAVIERGLSRKDEPT